MFMCCVSQSIYCVIAFSQPICTFFKGKHGIMSWGLTSRTIMVERTRITDLILFYVNFFLRSFTCTNEFPGILFFAGWRFLLHKYSMLNCVPWWYPEYMRDTINCPSSWINSHLYIYIYIYIYIAVWSIAHG